MLGASGSVHRQLGFLLTQASFPQCLSMRPPILGFFASILWCASGSPAPPPLLGGLGGPSPPFPPLLPFPPLPLGEFFLLKGRFGLFGISGGFHGLPDGLFIKHRQHDDNIKESARINERNKFDSDFVTLNVSNDEGGNQTNRQFDMDVQIKGEPNDAKKEGCLKVHLKN